MGKIGVYFEEHQPVPIERRKLYCWIKDVITLENHFCGNISIILCSDGYLLEINRKFLKHGFYTDIVTFNYNSQNIISGDLFVSLDRVKDNAVIYCVDFRDELKRVIIHGILHLLGYNDKTPDEKITMREKEDFYLNKLVKAE
jgi:probable rRNA maturation factor